MNTGNSNAYIPGQYPVFPQKKKKIWPWILVGVLILVFVILPIISIIVMMSSSNFFEKDWFADSPYVGVMYIEGTITGNSSYFGLVSDTYDQQFLMDTVEQMIDDPMNKGLMLYINSPGGELYPTDELYRALLKYKELGRPIYAYCAEMAASGGYYLACAADKIYANPICTTGSIGVTYGTHIDVSEFLEKAGIKATDLASDNNKMMGSIFSPLTEAQLSIYQSQIDEYYKLFLDVVSSARGIKDLSLRMLADGRTYTAKQALDVELIDGITDFDGAMEAMFADNEFGDDVSVHPFIKEVNFNSLYSLFLSAINFDKKTKLTELEAYLSAINYYVGPLVYYPGR